MIDSYREKPLPKKLLGWRGPKLKSIILGSLCYLLSVLLVLLFIPEMSQEAQIWKDVLIILGIVAWSVSNIIVAVYLFITGGEMKAFYKENWNRKIMDWRISNEEDKHKD